MCERSACSVRNSVLVTGEVHFLGDGTRASAATPRLLVLTDGGWQTLSPTPVAIGTGFRDVPPGVRMLELGRTFVAGVKDTVDVSELRMERSNLRFVDGGTTWVMSPRNLVWSPNAAMQAYSPDLALWSNHYEWGTTGPLGSAAVTFNHLAGVGTPTVALPQNDLVYFSVMTPVDGGPALRGISIAAVAQAGSARLTLGGASTPTVPIDFDAGRPLQLAITWAVPQSLLAVGAALADPSLPSSFQLTYSVMPYVDDAGITGPSGDLVIVSGAELSGSSLALSLPLRSAYPSEWTPIFTRQWCGGSATHEADGGAERVSPQVCVVTQSTSGVDEPQAMVVYDIALDGTSLMVSPGQPLRGVTVNATGTLSWRGTAASWWLRASSFDGTAWRDGPSLVVPGSRTDAVSTPLPPGFLTPGRPTWLYIGGSTQGTIEERPFAASLPFTGVFVPTGVFHVR